MINSSIQALNDMVNSFTRAAGAPLELAGADDSMVPPGKAAPKPLLDTRLTAARPWLKAALLDGAPREADG